MTAGHGLIFNYAGAADWAIAPTKGLVPYRRRRARGTSSAAEDAREANEWAKTMPWFPRVKAVRCCVRFWAWFVEPATDEEREVLRQIEAGGRR